MEDLFRHAWDFASGNAIISGLIVAAIVAGSGLLSQLIKKKGACLNNEKRHPKTTTSKPPRLLKKMLDPGENRASEDYNELRAHHDALPPLSRSEFLQNIIGLRFNWTGHLEGASKKHDILDLSFKVGDIGSIYSEVPYAGHEFIALAKHGAAFQIEGVIERVYSAGNLVVQVTKLKAA